MNVKVTWCGNCPFFINEYDDDFNYSCNHPKIENIINEPYKHNSNKIEMDQSGYDFSYIEVPITPDWCPLNKEPITIEKV